MRWLRPTVPRDVADEGVEEVEALLFAAGADAPPSAREARIRADLLDALADERAPMPGLAPLALVAGALLLALAIGVGAPAVGSFISTLLDRVPAPSVEVLPDPSVPDAADVVEVPMPSDLPLPTREVPASPAVVVPGDAVAPAGDAPSVATPAPQPAAPAPPPWTPTPSPDAWSPGGPPIPVPTPPASGPPPGTPRTPGG